MVLQFPLHRFAALGELSPDDVSGLLQLGEKPVTHARGTTIIREGDRTRGVYLLVGGWVASSVVLRSGKRLIQKLHLPGDMLGTPSMVQRSSGDTLTALTEVTISFVPEANLARMFREQPRLTALFLMAVQMERLSLIDTLATVSQSSDRERLSTLLLDLHGRLDAIGAVEDDTFDLPISQEVIADLIGLTSVHVNRTLRVLQELGVITRAGQRMHLKNLPALRQLSPMPLRRHRFEPDWLPAKAK